MNREKRRPWTFSLPLGRSLAAMAVLVACGVTGLAAPLAAAPPKVVKASPDDGDAVDPALATLRVEFDQDMRRAGFSICGNDTGISGRPEWKSARVVEAPLKLEPGRKYTLSINCPRAQNFKSAAGEPAVAYPITFRTLAAGEQPQPPLADAAKRAIVKRLREVIDRDYSYRDLRVADWDAAFAQHAAAFEQATSERRLAAALAKALEGARDVHLTIQAADGDLLATFRRQVRVNWSRQQIELQVPEFKLHPGGVGVGRFAEGIGYILIGSWSLEPAQLEPAFAALKTFGDAPGIVIDVRPNAGGSELPARDFAGCFIRQEAVYSRHKTRDASAADGFSGPVERRIKPNADRPAVSVPAVVLIGPATMSSCESFVLMMRAAGAKLVGERTYGSSGNPKSHDLGGGIRVAVPSWQDLLPDGTLLEGRGIDPDISIPPGVDDQSGSDPTLDAALAYLRKK